MVTTNFSLTSMNFYLPTWCHIPQASFLHFLVLYIFFLNKETVFHSCKIGHTKAYLFLFWHNSPHWARVSSFKSFSRSHTKTHYSRKDSSGRVISSSQLTTHNIHNRQTSMSAVEFEPTISVGERPQTHVLDRAVTGTNKTSLTGRHFLEGRRCNTGIRSLSTDINFCSYS